MQEHESSDISDFNFRQIGQSAFLSPSDRRGTGFVPMSIIAGESEFTPYNNSQDEEPVEVGPPVVEITEADLNQRIADSYNNGMKEGKELAERGLANVFRTLRASSETIHDLREKVLREAEDDLLHLTMLIARKVIIREVSQDRSILSAVLQNAISGLSEREEITVRINPDDYFLATSGRETFLAKELLNERLRLKPDPSIAQGFCQVDTIMGTIDAGLDSQMEEIYRHLLEQRSNSIGNF